MQKDASLRLEKHRALQQMANHYNFINWTLHSIFIALHSLFLHSLVERLFNHKRTDVVVALGCSIVGVLAVLAWRMIYVRHRSIIRTMYEELHKTEKEIQDKLPSDFHDCGWKVHLAIKEKENIQITTAKLLIRTRWVITCIQVGIVLLYVVTYVGILLKD